MAVNQFLPFGTSSGANVIDQATYSGLAARSGGFTAGTASSAACNKVWRQTSIMSAVLAQFISDQTGQDANDDGTTATLLANLKLANMMMHGQCRLAKSGSNLLLSPFNGSKLLINGIPQSIPSAGVSLAATGLTVSTLYFIYAYMNSGVMTLEPSTTGHATDSTTGVEIKSGDPTRTLVGMARPITGPAWQDTAAQRFVRSWFNDPGVAGNAGFTSNHATTSTSYVELGTEIRNEFLCWAGEIVLVGGSGISSQTGTGLNSTAVGFDGISTLEPGSYSAGYVAAAGGFAVPYTISFPKTGLSEGYHYATLAGKVQSGNGTWSGGTYLPGTPDQCSLTTYIKK